MPKHDIIVIGASAGGVEAFMELAGALPQNFPAAVFMVLHTPPDGLSQLPDVLARSGPLYVAYAKDGEKIQSGRIYVAPPDNHMLIKPGLIRIIPGPRENRARPAIDPLFRTAAQAYRDRVVGVVLSGLLSDGTNGLKTIKMYGGVTVVQAPEDAQYAGMPLSAIGNVAVDHILPVSEIGPLLTVLTNSGTSGNRNPSQGTYENVDPDPLELAMEEKLRDRMQGKPTSLTCPECGGVMWEVAGGNGNEFRCHVGHAYSLDNLDAGHSSMLEDALWSAVRALHEKEEIANRLAARMKEHSSRTSVPYYEKKAREAKQHAALIRKILTKERDKEEIETSEA
jgi:two-component system chemotaxis response regulator CheB